MQIDILSLEALWWRHELIEGQMTHEIISPTHAFSNHDIKVGVNGLSEELFWFLKWHVFDQICIILPIAVRADFELWRALTALWKVKSDWN